MPAYWRAAALPVVLVLAGTAAFAPTDANDFTRGAMSSDARVVSSRDTTPLAVLAAKLAGEWGWITDGPGCRENPHTISFSGDGRYMDISYREAVDSTGVRVKRYEIRAQSVNHVRGLIVSPPETRRTAAGDPVVWDLVLTAPDVYQWRRTDWPADGFTAAVIRCADLRAPASDPAGLARVILEALAAGDIFVAAAHVDPAELRRTRLAFDSLLAADSANYLSRRLFRIDSTAQLRRLSDMEFTSGLYVFWVWSRASEEFRRNVRGAQVLGSVGGNDTAHVVYRWRFPRDSVQQRSAQVFTMVRSRGRWWAQSMGDYSDLIRLLKEPMVPVDPRPTPRQEQRQ